MAKRKGATAAFLRALRKKHGLGEFKGKSRRVSVRHSSSKMAKKKRFFSRKGLSVNQLLIGGAVYGFARNKVSSWLRQTIGGNLGNVSDEILMGIVAYFAAKRGSGIVKDAGKAGLAIEAARFASNFNFNLGGNQTQTSSSNGGVVTYG
ncbi:hypothetical protein HYX00_01470 [Candidatus Woesearchaeota archaeon]|nr:hypothetical protein [Candidatus Woesearchaeota archaeon]